MTDKSDILSARHAAGELDVVLEPRMTRERYSDLREQAASRTYHPFTLFTAGVSRATANMTAIEEFYLTGFGTRPSQHIVTEASIGV